MSIVVIEICIKALTPFSLAETHLSKLEKDITSAYAAKGRHYHTLHHLATMYTSLQPVWEKLQRPELVAFAILYHDFYYKATRKDNEERSAEKAYSQMMLWNMPEEDCERVEDMILATKAHPENLDDNDTAYLLDADLVALGSDWPSYETYYKGVRKEYRIYPNVLYKPGRKKVLQHFLDMKNIYRTDYFRKNYEEQARENLVNEIRLL